MWPGIYIYIYILVEFAPMVWRPEFNPRSRHTKYSKNGTLCLLA